MTRSFRMPSCAALQPAEATTGGRPAAGTAAAGGAPSTRLQRRSAGLRFAARRSRSCFRSRSSCWCVVQIYQSTKVGVTPRGTPERAALQHFHISVGLTVLLLVLARLWLWTVAGGRRGRRACPPPRMRWRALQPGVLPDVAGVLLSPGLSSPGPMAWRRRLVRPVHAAGTDRSRATGCSVTLGYLHSVRRLLDPLPHGLQRAGCPCGRRALSGSALAAAAGLRMGECRWRRQLGYSSGAPKLLHASIFAACSPLRRGRRTGSSASCR